ncbi:MAG: SDR family oxidoreductase [Chloroflexi bacterium]|nr:SDR family oxidoreductase [Chloroflexota bacterium]
MILITGASGTVGRELAQQLLETGRPIRVLTRDAQKLSTLKGRVDIAEGDLSQPETLYAALRGIDRLFLVTSSTQQDAYVLQAGKEAGVRHIVKLSTFEAVDPKMAEHVQWHREREELIRFSGLAWTFLRPTMFMSAALDWAKTIREEGVFYFPGGEGRVPAIDPWDIAAVAAVALTKPGHEGQAYALTGPQNLSFGEMAQVLTRVLEKPIRYENISDETAVEGMRKAGLPEYVVEGLVGTFAVLRSGRLSYTTNDVARITGRTPRTFEAWCRVHKTAFL